MDAPIEQPPITCTQCGAELHPDEGQIFVTCRYCGSAVYLDKSRVVFHWSLAPTLDEAQAQGALRRWMASNQTVKDLDQKAHLESCTFEYFPIWYFKRRASNGHEEAQLMPAAATAVSEIRSLRLPAGDLRKYSSDLASQSTAPTVPLQAALDWLNALPALPEKAAVVEQSLVHIPLYTCKYMFNSRPYTALVDGATGAVFANIYPAKAEAPYLAVGGLTALVFLCLALIPIGFSVAEDAGGAGLGLLICAGAGLVAAPILFGLAAWVAAKV